MNLAQMQAESAGEKVSCRKGCDACCRQMVPIAPVEAFALAAHLDALPPGTAAPVLERFDQAVEALDEKGLLEPLRRRHALSVSAMRAVDRAYFAAQIACPFLEEGACTIHAVRPLACREYLVTSPASQCAAPEAERVRPLVLGAKLSRVLAKGQKEWVPLALAREYVAHHREAQVEDPRESLLAMLQKLS